MNDVYSVVCMGYCFIGTLSNDELEMKMVSLPYSTTDVAISEGWTQSTYHRFSIDGKTPVWLCPKCSKIWKEERDIRIDEIMNLAIENMTERQYWNLVGELQGLDATREEKDKFSSLLFPARANE